MNGNSEPQAIAQGLRWQTHAKLGASVSALYVWSYFVTVSVITPLQVAVFPSFVMSLLFLPHGVRVLTAWMYGWRSVGYLLPGAVLCNLHFAGDRAFDGDILAGTLASLLAGPVAFAVVRRIVGPGAMTVGAARLQAVVAVGFLASMVNLISLKLAYGLSAAEGVVIFVGDTSGLLASVLIVWGTLRLLGRHL